MHCNGLGLTFHLKRLSVVGTTHDVLRWIDGDIRLNSRRASPLQEVTQGGEEDGSDCMASGCVLAGIRDGFAVVAVSTWSVNFATERVRNSKGFQVMLKNSNGIKL